MILAQADNNKGLQYLKKTLLYKRNNKYVHSTLGRLASEINKSVVSSNNNNVIAF